MNYILVFATVCLGPLAILAVLLGPVIAKSKPLKISHRVD